MSWGDFVYDFYGENHRQNPPNSSVSLKYCWGDFVYDFYGENHRQNPPNSSVSLKYYAPLELVIDMNLNFQKT
jgi:hypothetical protein